MVQPISGQAIYVVLMREIKRYWRAKARIISSIAQSFFFLLFFGMGVGSMFSGGSFGPGGYLGYIAPGIIGMGLLFGSVFSGVSVIFDRQFGFMKEMLVAPVSRTSIIIGKILGGALTASIQGVILLGVSTLIGAFSFVPLPLFVIGVLLSIGVMILITAGFVGLGVAIGSSLNDFHAFQLLVTFVIWPLFMLSGVFFPFTGAPSWLQIAMLCDPMFYGVEAMRVCLGSPVSLDLITIFSGIPVIGPVLVMVPWLVPILVLVLFTSIMVAIGTFLFSRAQV
ncbi:MAG: ABC transporter permease [Promethearchaeota archaeon]